ncbi:hypothetical protein [Botrimarina sp.]|uniref:hypothetical protein n=1 Tax=Botrimarina sp. TaxID=2795802 RepID=UPI0032EF8B1F
MLALAGLIVVCQDARASIHVSLAEVVGASSTASSTVTSDGGAARFGAAKEANSATTVDAAAGFAAGLAGLDSPAARNLASADGRLTTLLQIASGCLSPESGPTALDWQASLGSERLVLSPASSFNPVGSASLLVSLRELAPVHARRAASPTESRAHGDTPADHADDPDEPLSAPSEPEEQPEEQLPDSALVALLTPPSSGQQTTSGAGSNSAPGSGPTSVAMPSENLTILSNAKLVRVATEAKLRLPVPPGSELLRPPRV